MGYFSGEKEEIAKFVGVQWMLEISMLAVGESFKIIDINCSQETLRSVKKYIFVILSSRSKRGHEGYIRGGFWRKRQMLQLWQRW